VSGERILAAAVGGAVTAIATALGWTAVDRNTPPEMPQANCVAVVENLARIQADTRSEADRWACKYRRAAGEGVARGWKKPGTRREWDAICLPGEEDGP